MYRACHFRPRKHRLATTGLALAMAIVTHQAQSRACTAQVEVHDRAQDQVLPTYRKFGRRWISGEPGHEYDLRIRSCADVRVLAVISVDGVNVITGQSASHSQSGYVLELGENLTVEGWRKSMERTAAFVFTDPADSYAARTGRPNDLGVIGVALFRELRPKVVAQEWNSGLYAVPSSPAEPAAEAAAKADADTARTRRSASLGTGHGRSEHSPAQWTTFERASDDPDETISIRYETHATLLSLGVLPRRWFPDHDPEPFPQLGFVPDP
jgi:hypothetical protein